MFLSVLGHVLSNADQKVSNNELEKYLERLIRFIAGSLPSDDQSLLMELETFYSEHTYTQHIDCMFNILLNFFNMSFQENGEGR